MVRIAAVVLLCLGVVSCAPPVTHQTASGRPEVTIATTNVDAVKGALISVMINGGYSITRESHYLLAFDRPVDNVLAAALLGSQYDSTPNARISYTVARIQSGIRVVADLAIVTNPGSAFERHTNMNANQDSLGVQKLLLQIKSQVEADW